MKFCLPILFILFSGHLAHAERLECLKRVHQLVSIVYSDTKAMGDEGMETKWYEPAGESYRQAAKIAQFNTGVMYAMMLDVQHPSIEVLKKIELNWAPLWVDAKVIVSKVGLPASLPLSSVPVRFQKFLILAYHLQNMEYRDCENMIGNWVFSQSLLEVVFAVNRMVEP